MEISELQQITAEEMGDKAGTESCGRFLQSVFWAQFKSAHGWKSYFFRVKPAGTVLSVLSRAFFGASFAYIPMWPESDIGSTANASVSDAEAFSRLLVSAACELKRFLPANTLCIRFDPAIEFDSLDKAAAWKKRLLRHQQFMQRQKLKESLYDVQPPDTVLLNLTLSTEILLTQMKSKCRYNIRLAEKNGVTVRVAGASEIDVFYTLYQTTAKRDRIAIHSRDYYESLLRQKRIGTEIRLYIAEHKGEALAAIITLFSAREAVYLYGASSNDKRNLMPAYVLQWQAIQDAKQYGSTIYDFYGIPPTDDEKHPMHGLYRFKTGFGGKIIHRIGSIDIPLSWKYPYYRFAESIRSTWYKRINKLFKKR